MREFMTWDLYATELARYGLTHIFGMVGDGIGLLEAGSRCVGLQVVTSRDQRAAASMAMGYAQASGKCAIYVGSPGPGLCNSTSAILEAWSGAIPLIIISNGVSREQIGQGAFQEFDAIGMFKPMTKWAYRVQHEERLQWALHRAVTLAMNGRPGPVFLEIPNDLTQIKLIAEPTPTPRRMETVASCTDIDQLSALLRGSRNITLIVGGGAKRSQAGAAIQSLGDHLDAALLTTASGRGCLDETNDRFLGVGGLYLSSPAEEFLSKSDCFVFLGSQIEETALIGFRQFLLNKNVVQIDIDPDVIGKSLQVNLGLVGDVNGTVKELLLKIPKRPPDPEFQLSLKDIKRRQKSILSDDFGSHPVRVSFQKLRRAFPGSITVVFDNGLNDMWGYFYPLFEADKDCDCITPAEQTGLGLSIGAAFGAKVAQPHRYVVAVVGDGAMSLGISALLSNSSIGVTFIVINNDGFGWPRLAQGEAGIDIGCRFEDSFDLRAITNFLSGSYCRPKTTDDLDVALEKSRLANLAGKVAIIELDMSGREDIPVGVMKHYMTRQ